MKTIILGIGYGLGSSTGWGEGICDEYDGMDERPDLISTELV